jgi:3-methyladenine DNA glycosylase Mpg
MGLDDELQGYVVGSLPRLTTPFFQRTSPEVAYDLLGMYLVRRFPANERKPESHVALQIREMDAFRGETDHSADESLHAGPGIIGISHGVQDNSSPACVTFRGGAAYFGGTQKVGGPGLLTQALQIGHQFQGDDICNNDYLWIEGRPIDLSQKKLRRISAVSLNHLGRWYIPASFL